MPQPDLGYSLRTSLRRLRGIAHVQRWNEPSKGAMRHSLLRRPVAVDTSPQRMRSQAALRERDGVDPGAELLDVLGARDSGEGRRWRGQAMAHAEGPGASQGELEQELALPWPVLLACLRFLPARDARACQAVCRGAPYGSGNAVSLLLHYTCT